MIVLAAFLLALAWHWQHYKNHLDFVARAAAISTLAGGLGGVLLYLAYCLLNSPYGAGALDRDKQIGLVEKLTDLIAAAANDATIKLRTWVLLAEAAPGGWGLWGHAHTNEELVTAAREEIRKLRQ